MFSRLGTLVVRRRRFVLWLTGAFLVVAGPLGSGVFDVVKSGGLEDPGSESVRARELLEERFGQGDPNIVVLVSPADGDVDSPAGVELGTSITERLAAIDEVTDSASYWSLGRVPPLKSTAGDKAIAFAYVAGDEDQLKDVSARVVDELAGELPEGTIEVGGMGPVIEELITTVESDLARAEMVAIPITLVLLVLVFGGLVAASLPLVVGVVAVMGGFFSLWVLSRITDVSVFSINLTTAMGLGLAIDYSLFMVSRFREELRIGRTVDAAVIRTVETAGRTVAFSGLTVAVSLAALLVFPLYFLRSFAYAGVAVVMVASLAAVVSLPALLAVLGTRVDRFEILKRPAPEAGTGFWHRNAEFVMKRPISVVTVVVAVLVLLGLPFLGVKFGSPDDRVLPKDADTRQVSQQLRNDFESNEGASFAVVVDDDVDDAAIDVYAAAVSGLEGVSRVDAATGSYIARARVIGPNDATARFRGGGVGTWLSVVPDVEPLSPEGEHLIKDVRDLEADFDVLVGGSAARLIDSKATIFERLPWAGLIIAASTFVLLFLMFGSLLVPAKAVVLNLLSLSATFGAMVWVFQDGNGAGLLDFTATGTLDTTVPILMFCVAFGLSMDYEVFLLSRIKEEHDLTGDNTASVAMGLERTGRIVTAAAVLLAVTFLAIGTSGVTFIKLSGVGLALAIVMDATVIRATLVPAFMKLAGDANWWAPAPLRRFHDRFGIREHVPGDVLDEAADQDLASL